MPESFMSFFQMMAVINLGLVFIDKKSGIVKLQDAFHYDFTERYRPKLNEVGAITQRIRTDRYSSTEEGKNMIALAETIRGEKDAFGVKTDEERSSLFLPSLGLLAGLVGLLYLLLVPFYTMSNNVLFLYLLEYISEAAWVSSAVTVLALSVKSAFPTRVSVLILSFMWFILSLVVIAIAYLFGWNISCFSAHFYLSSIVLLQFFPVIFILFRFGTVLWKRYLRYRNICKKAIQLKAQLDAYSTTM